MTTKSETHFQYRDATSPAEAKRASTPASDALTALARLLARQAAREAVADAGRAEADIAPLSDSGEPHAS